MHCDSAVGCIPELIRRGKERVELISSKYQDLEVYFSAFVPKTPCMKKGILILRSVADQMTDSRGCGFVDESKPSLKDGCLSSKVDTYGKPRTNRFLRMQFISEASALSL